MLSKCFLEMLIFFKINHKVKNYEYNVGSIYTHILTKNCNEVIEKKTEDSSA